MRIVAKHRNHLAVISKDLLDFDSDVWWDFTTGVNQSLEHKWMMYPPQRNYIEVGGVACLWTGDLNTQDYSVDNLDVGIFDRGWRANLYGFYHYDPVNGADVTMDGFIDNRDGGFIIQNFRYNVFSSIGFFVER